ncbi:MAG: zinc ribbon domain-containing protein [Candidatus Bruticola sp.]
MFLSSLLLKIQDLDDKIAELNREIEAIEASPAKWPPVRELQAKRQVVQHRLETLTRETDQLSLQEEELQKKNKKLHDKLYNGTTCSVKELSDIERDLKETEAKLSPLCEIIINNIDELDRLHKQLENIDKELEPKEREAKQYSAHLQRKVAAARLNIDKLQQQRPQILDELPAEARSSYCSLYRSQNIPAVSVLENRICTICRARVPEHKLSAIYQNRLTFCENCGRILAIRRSF